MRTRTRIATAIATGAVAATMLASPALARTESGRGLPDQDRLGQRSMEQSATCDGTQSGSGARWGQNGRGDGRQSSDGQGNGAGTDVTEHMALSDVPTGTVTDAQGSVVAALAEEEKLAHDLYVAFADLYPARTFARIAAAETQHLAAVRLLLDRYEITDPTMGLPAGTFATPATQDLFDTLLADGSASIDAAYAVARTVESTDIADLTSAVVGVNAADVLRVYENLRTASEHHLVAFGG